MKVPGGVTVYVDNLGKLTQNLYNNSTMGFSCQNNDAVKHYNKCVTIAILN